MRILILGLIFSLNVFAFGTKNYRLIDEIEAFGSNEVTFLSNVFLGDEILLRLSDGTYEVSLTAPASLSGDYTLRLPVADGTSGQLLSTNGSGILSFVTGSTASGVETLTNKTIDGDNNTLLDIAITSLKTDAGAANTFLSRDGSGAVISTKAVPTGAVLGTTDTQTLTNKTIDADLNTITNIENADIKTGAAIALNKLANISTGIVLGRYTAGSGAIEEVGVGNGVEISGTGIRRSALTGDVTASAGSNTTVLDPTAISGKTAQVTPGDTDEFLLNDAGTLKKITFLNLAAALGGGGGGGGGSVVWDSEDSEAPIVEYLFSNKVWSFEDGLSQNLYTTIKVPSSYEAGNPIAMAINFFHQAASASMLLLAQSTLISVGDAFDSTTNQRTTTNTAQTAGAKEIAVSTLDLTDSSGEINSVAVAPGDLIKVRLYRSTDTATDDVSFIESSTEVTFQ